MNPNHGDYGAVVRDPRDGCQHEPKESRGALLTDRHFQTVRATVIVGPPHSGSIRYRLCASCAQLPAFRDRLHTPIAKGAAKS